MKYPVCTVKIMATPRAASVVRATLVQAATSNVLETATVSTANVNVTSRMATRDR